MLGAMGTLITDEIYQFLILFLLAGTVAGAIATRGILFKVYFLAISSLLLPIIITLTFTTDYALSGALLGLTLVFYAFMLSVGKNYSDTIGTNIHLWLNLEREVEAHKQTEKELLQAKQRAEIANETKNQFLASISHELRTPLNGIIGFSSALRKSHLDGPQMSYAEHIGSCSRTLLNMVNDVLEITTIEAGHLELHPHPFNLSHEMNEVVALAQRLAEDKGLHFEYHIAADLLPSQLIGDMHRAKQVINNLISNAIKYTDRGHVKLEVSCLSVDQERALIHFVVEDSGIGIPAAAHATLFDSFTQASSFDHRRHDGVGLGLFIVSNLLQQMHGEINFESIEDKGSRFKVQLPFAVMKTGNHTFAQTAPDNRAGEIPYTLPLGELNRLRVLIVDDNDINRLVLRTFLDPYNIPYKEAANGEEALALLNNNVFDLVLLDIHMPDMSGFDVRAAYCRTSREPPHFVAVTAHAFKEEIKKILNAGFDDCLIKPIAEDQLIGMMKRFATQL
jgi:signal transduction histidine kinase